MSFNITLKVEVDEEGKKYLSYNETASYLDNAPEGTYVISGHHVGETEGGYEYANLQTPMVNVQGGYYSKATPVVAEPVTPVAEPSPHPQPAVDAVTPDPAAPPVV